MPNMKWDKLNQRQLGRYGEYYAKMEFASYGYLVCFLRFEDDKLPEIYIIPATAWHEPNAVLVDRKYDKPEQKSKPEWGISYTKKNKMLLEKYRAERFFEEKG